MRKILLLSLVTLLVSCNSDRVTKDPFIISQKRIYPSLVTAPPACKTPEYQEETFCKSYNSLEILTRSPTI